jgi:F-type H+-transporting ATPase subunit delta
MNESKISVRYAKALLQSAQDKKNLDAVYQEMIQLHQLFRQVHEFGLFLHNPIVPQSKKLKMIRTVFSDKVTELTLAFLEMIVQNKREMYIQDITRRFLDDYKHHKGITTVILTTVVPVDQELKKQIVQLIEENYKTTVELEERQNEHLIGGFIIRIDDNMMDASVAKELRNLRKELISKEFIPH